MTITKRTVPTFEITADSRIQVREWNQIIETTQDEDGNDVIRVIESLPHTSVIDPAEGEYDEKVKALGEKLLGKHQFEQETLIRKSDDKCKTAEAMCAKHCETITALEKVVKAQESTIQELNASISAQAPEKEVVDEKSR